MLSIFDSLLLYLFTYVTAALLISLSKKTEIRWLTRVCFAIGITIPIMLSFFRVNVGTDYRNYQIMYRNYTRISFGSFFSSNELFYGWGTWIISRIASHIGGERVFFALFSLLLSLFAFKGFESMGVDNWFLVSLAFFLGPFSSGLNIMKQALATAIVFWGLRFVRERKLIKFCITVLIAVLFHTTALIALPIYFLYENKDNDRIWNFKSVFYVVAAVIVVVNFVNVLQALGSINIMNISRFSMYLSGDGTSNMTFFLSLLEFFVILVHQKRLVDYNRQYKLLIVLMGVGLCFDAVGFVSVFAKRISSYYGTYPFLILSSCLSEFYTQRNKTIVNILIALFFIILFVYSYYFRGFANLIPYKYL